MGFIFIQKTSKTIRIQLLSLFFIFSFMCLATFELHRGYSVIQKARKVWAISLTYATFLSGSQNRLHRPEKSKASLTNVFDWIIRRLLSTLGSLLCRGKLCLASRRSGKQARRWKKLRKNSAAPGVRAKRPFSSAAAEAEAAPPTLLTISRRRIRPGGASRETPARLPCPLLWRGASSSLFRSHHEREELKLDPTPEQLQGIGSSLLRAGRSPRPKEARVCQKNMSEFRIG